MREKADDIHDQMEKMNKKIKKDIFSGIYMCLAVALFKISRPQNKIKGQ